MQELTVREGENNSTWFRTNRIFQADGDWYFSTREGRNIGPYGNRPATEAGLQRFIKCLTEKRRNSPSFEFASQIALGGVWKTTLMH